MAKKLNIQEHMEVVGCDGRHVGIVDRVEGADRIKLGKRDPKAGGQHHFIPVGWVDHVNEHVHLNKSSRDATAQWQAERPAAAPQQTAAGNPV
jgi:hypothetical protein